jgi:hypothetical protein
VIFQFAMLVDQRVVRNHGIFRLGISTFQQGTMRAWDL